VKDSCVKTSVLNVYRGLKKQYMQKEVFYAIKSVFTNQKIKIQLKKKSSNIINPVMAKLNFQHHYSSLQCLMILQKSLIHSFGVNNNLLFSMLQKVV